jgi:hypothetical protein
VRRALAALSVIALSACSTPKVSMAPGPREYVADDYQLVLQRWTREEHLIQLSELDDLLTVSATYESWDFRWAYVVRYSQDYRLTTAQRRDLLDRTLAETKQDHEFYVALYGTKWRWSDLTKPESSWIVRLIDEKGNETAPSKLVKVKPGPLETRYFPYTTPWRQAFRISFPATSEDGRPTIAPDAKWFGLRFAGPQGNEELHWDVEGEEAKKAAFGDGDGQRASF